MISKAKFDREVARLKSQISGIQWRIRGRIERYKYDLQYDRHLNITQAQQPLRSEAAVILVYQPNGILDSTLFQLNWLNRNDVSPVLVANHPLSAEDYAALEPLCYLIIERPNVGYDFGGYRDGVLTLLAHGLPANALYVLNDSMWFPLDENSDVIDRCRASTADLFGLHISSFSRRDAKDYIQSYFVRFSGKVAHSKYFDQYWRNLSLINDKYTVVKTHERHLSQKFAAQGWTVDGLSTLPDFKETLLALPDEDFFEVVAFQCVATPTEADRLSKYLRNDSPISERRAKLNDLIKKGKAFSTLVTAHPLVLKKMGVPMLKKARTEALITQRNLMRDRNFTADFPVSIASEIEHWDSV